MVLIIEILILSNSVPLTTRNINKTYVDIKDLRNDYIFWLKDQMSPLWNTSKNRWTAKSLLKHINRTNVDKR